MRLPVKLYRTDFTPGGVSAIWNALCGEFGFDLNSEFIIVVVSDLKDKQYGEDITSVDFQAED